MLRHSSRKFGLAFLMVSQVAFGASREQSLSFRGYLQGYPDPDQAVFWDVDYWDSALRERASEGFSAIVWYGPNEFTNGRHLLVRHSEFPEARELSAAENERLIAHWQVLFARAHEYGLENYLLTQHIFVTKALPHSTDYWSPWSPLNLSARATGHPRCHLALSLRGQKP